jgi:MOSC domain-containing protein
MANITRLYQVPVKGLTPLLVDELAVAADGAVAGDRVLGFLFADAGEPDEAGWRGKTSFLTMQNTPAFARVDARYDPASRHLSLTYEGSEVVSGDVSSDVDRDRIVEAVTALVQGFEENPLAEHGSRMPLRLVGDGVTPRFHDRKSHHVTLVASASIEALAERIGSDVDERRFRMNATIDGLEPWQELDWIGKTIQIGGGTYDVTGPVVRCLATHANPVTGERDQDVMQTLTREFGQERPTMGVLAVPRAASVVSVGDEVAAD